MAQAQAAVQIALDEFQAQMALGDILTALGRAQGAKPAYQRALAITATMEPSAMADWVPQIQKKLQ